PDEGTLPNTNAASEAGARGDVREITDDPVVIHATSRVDDRVPADYRVWLHDGAGEHDRPLPKPDARCDDRARMDEGDPGDEPFEPVSQLCSHPVIADREHRPLDTELPQAIGRNRPGDWQTEHR